MLNEITKQKLQNSIEDALEKAMKDAFMATFEIKNSDDPEVQAKIDESKKKVSDAFAKEAKTCAKDIADAIDVYIKSAQITINTGMSFTGVGLASPAGPVTGSLVLAAPVILQNSVS